MKKRRVRKSKTKITQVAPPKNTGGGGFGFEDKIDAYALICLLTGSHFFDPVSGPVTKVDLQTNADGWLLDDLLVQSETGGQLTRLAISAKSNQQITRNGFPDDLVGAIWAQVLHEHSSVFNAATDGFAIVTAPLSQAINDDVQELLGWARDKDPAKLAAHVRTPKYGNIVKRALLKSFDCPQALRQKHQVDDTMAAQNLARLQVNAFTPETESLAIQHCRDALLDKSQPAALELWNRLQKIARDSRANGGSFTLAQLVARVRREHALVEYPEFQADWQRLHTQSQEQLDQIQSQLAQKCTIQRGAVISVLTRALADKPAALLVGESGTGKSAIAKYFVRGLPSTSVYVWVKAEEFLRNTATAFAREIGLQHDLSSIFASAGQNTGYVVIDACEVLHRDADFQNLASLVRLLNLTENGGFWRLLLVCQSEDLTRVQSKLMRFGIIDAGSSSNVVPVTSLDDTEFQQAVAAFPSLGRLQFRPHLRSLLRRPKVLDLFCSYAQTARAVNTSQWTGESDLIEWFWESEITARSDAFAVENALFRLVEYQAETWQTEVLSSDLIPADALVLDRLRQDRICRRTKQGRLGLSHDLFSDWVRQRILVARAPAVAAYLESRGQSPFWQRAIRLYGIHLLEQNPTVEPWIEVYQSLAAPDKKASTAQDSLLEAAVFSADPLPLLEKLWPDLKKGDPFPVGEEYRRNDGHLLRRLLGRFLFSATLPNPAVLHNASRLGLAESPHVATIERVPLWSYWLPMLTFLHDHRVEAARLAPGQTAEVAERWLKFTVAGTPLRDKAAEIIVAAAQTFFEYEAKGFDKADRLRIEEYGKKAVCQALLVAHTVLPASTSPLLLVACGRQDPVSLGFASNMDRGRLTPAWPNGPKWTVNHHFSGVFLRSGAADYIFGSTPELGREILLALLIEGRLPARFAGDHSRDANNRAGLAGIGSSWLPPFYDKGPFLSFLRINPTVGVDTILRLVNFAAQRTAERPNEYETPQAVGVTVQIAGTEKTWVGGARIFGWAYGSSNAPHVIESALMALEKWFYDELAEGHSVESHVERILAGSETVAFAGVLLTVGKRDHEFLLGRLQALLAVADFYIWDAEMVIGNRYPMMGWGFRDSPEAVEEARLWHNLPHRKFVLSKIVSYLFVSVQAARSFFEGVREQWHSSLAQQQVGADHDRIHRIRQLAATFDLANWRELPQQEDGKTLWEFQLPVDLTHRDEEKAKKANAHLLLISFPYTCEDLLKKGQPLSDEDLTAFWAQLTSFPTLPDIDDADLRPAAKANAICGGIAVLFELHEDWLSSQPDKLSWCMEQVRAVLDDPPPPDPLVFQHTISQNDWDCFMARIVAQLWADEPSNASLRELVAAIACTRRDAVVQVFWRKAATLRQKLGKSFASLQNLLVQCAAWRMYDRQPPVIRQDDFDPQPLWQNALTSFVQDKLSSEEKPWQSYELPSLTWRVEETMYGEFSGPTELHRAWPALDLEMLWNAYAWLPDYQQASSDAERDDVVRINRELLGVVLRTFPPAGTLQYSQIDGQPFAAEEKVVDQIAALILQLPSRELRAGFYTPLLDLDPKAASWIQRFIHHIFFSALETDVVHPRFVEVWKEMLDLAFVHPGWQLPSPSSRNRSDLCGLWCCLMGIDDLVAGLWTTGHAGTVHQMQSYFDRWIAHCRSEVMGCVQPLVSFFRRPIAKPMRIRALVELYAAMRTEDYWFWHGHNAKEHCFELLSMIWQKTESELRGNAAAFAAFEYLLNRLASFQMPAALALQDQVRASRY